MVHPILILIYSQFSAKNGYSNNGLPEWAQSLVNFQGLFLETQSMFDT